MTMASTNLPVFDLKIAITLKTHLNIANNRKSQPFYAALKSDYSLLLPA